MKRVLRVLVCFMLMACLSLSLSSMSLAAQAPRLNLKKLDLTKSTTFTIRVYNLGDGETATFKSSDSEVLKVTKVADNKRSCVISGKTVGKATLKVNIKKAGKVTDTLKCKINVTPVPVSIKFSESTITLTEGKQVYLDYKLIIKPNTSTEMPVFESSNEDIVTVNSNGRVTAMAPGKAKITATLLSTGKSATCTIVVKEDPSDD